MLSWLFLDLNAFFASCEQQNNPALRGRPVGVVPVKAETTCCIAASYEAKRFGVKTGTMVHEAREMCPHMVFVKAKPKLYTQYHLAIVAAIEDCLHIDAVHSIDEVACRLMGREREEGQARKLAAHIKETIRTRIGTCLTSSIGLAPNVFLAKVASDMQKPDGLTVLHKEALPGALLTLKPSDMPGVGRNMQVRLARAGIVTMADLWAAGEKDLRLIWGGIEGARFHAKLHGEEIDVPPTTRRCLGHQHVLEPHLRDADGAYAVLRDLCVKAAERLRREGFYCARLGLEVKYVRSAHHASDYDEAATSFHETQDTLFLQEQLEKLWRQMRMRKAPGQVRAKILRVGVALGELTPAAKHQMDFWHNPQRERLMAALDSVNARYGRNAVRFGLARDSSVEKKGPKIAFRRVPQLWEFT